MLGNIIGKADGIIIGIDVGTYPGYLDVSFDGYNYGKPEGLWLGE